MTVVGSRKDGAALIVTLESFDGNTKLRLWLPSGNTEDGDGRTFAVDRTFVLALEPEPGG